MTGARTGAAGLRTRLAVPATIAALVLAGQGCRDLDVVTASYATLQEAQQAGAVERGWLPPGLPAGTFDIREAHSTDTNRRWGLFSFPPEGSSSLRRLLEPTEASLAGQVCDAPGRIEWWPVLLRGELDEERIRAAGLRPYRTTDGTLLVAVNWSQRRAYYWTPASAGSR